MAYTYTETSDDKTFARLKITFTAADTTDWFMFSAPKSAFAVQSAHSTTGTYGVLLQGTVDGSNAIAIASRSSTNGASTAADVTGAVRNGIRISCTDMASSGSVTVTVVARDSA